MFGAKWRMKIEIGEGGTPSGWLEMRFLGSDFEKLGLFASISWVEIDVFGIEIDVLGVEIDAQGIEIDVFGVEIDADLRSDLCDLCDLCAGKNWLGLRGC